jgi:hypothetical protein
MNRMLRSQQAFEHIQHHLIVEVNIHLNQSLKVMGLGHS